MTKQKKCCQAKVSTSDNSAADKKMLSSILAHVVAIEKENKNLKDEANKKERAEELKVIGKSTQKVVKMHMLSQKTVKNAYVIICSLYFLIYRCTTFLKDDEYSKD